MEKAEMTKMCPNVMATKPLIGHPNEHRIVVHGFATVPEGI